MGLRGEGDARQQAAELNARGLYRRGLLAEAALREADACDRDGYDVTAAILRDLAERVREAERALREIIEARDTFGVFAAIDRARAVVGGDVQEQETTTDSGDGAAVSSGGDS